MSMISMSLVNKPWNSWGVIGGGLFCVEKLPVLTLSNNPLRLIASVDTFERDTKSDVADVSEFFNKDWNKKMKNMKSEKFCDKKSVCEISESDKTTINICWCCFYSMNFSYFYSLLQSTNIHNRNQFMFTAHPTACRHNNFRCWTSRQLQTWSTVTQV